MKSKSSSPPHFAYESYRSFWNYRSLAPIIKALSLVWYSWRSTSYGHPIASSKWPIRLKSNRKRQWCSWNWSNQGVEWWSLSYELQQTNYSEPCINRAHWWRSDVTPVDGWPENSNVDDSDCTDDIVLNHWSHSPNSLSCRTREGKGIKVLSSCFGTA